LNPEAIMAALAEMQGAGQQQQGQQPAQGDPTAMQVGQQMSQLRGSNPQLVLQHLKQMKQVAAALIPHTAETIPGVAQHLARTLQGLDRAIEAATKALTAETIAGAPINMSAVSGMSGGM
jgi:type VI protein secretion system component VasK